MCARPGKQHTARDVGARDAAEGAAATRFPRPTLPLDPAASPLRELLPSPHTRHTSACVRSSLCASHTYLLTQLAASASTACTAMYMPGTLNVSNMTSAVYSRFSGGFSGGSVCDGARESGVSLWALSGEQASRTLPGVVARGSHIGDAPADTTRAAPSGSTPSRASRAHAPATRSAPRARRAGTRTCTAATRAPCCSSSQSAHGGWGS